MERQLALDFVENEAKSTAVMIVPADYLWIYSNAPLIIKKHAAHANLDSLRFFESDILPYISDSIFLENYYDSFMNQIHAYGLQTYLPQDINSFIGLPQKSYVIKMAQMELVEDSSFVSVEEIIGNRNRELQIPVNKISLNTWFEISQKDSTQVYRYFDENGINDEVYGSFVQGLWDNDIRYDYTVFPLKKEEVYSLASFMGRRHAQFLFDLILNSFIWSALTTEAQQRYHYLHYNSQYHSIEVADEAFIMME
ncbi:MAG: hypothetical protein B7C24_14170 [Bacteroidetes bacterium 4572_77]|nr:MAG: hypothetical protein B7C24_14170 [Bacteroidetes bacterium 4572_77]